ncbi:MAG TPA: membrane protein insertase YidC [Trebonia sp.]|jgi:YidC/Oxa1 family membrane protein insertase|nr:membrane protein insertase YidC [Trebonia sp.]
MSALFGVPEDAAYHLVLALTSLLAPVLGGLAAVAGVVLLTIAVRLLVMPLSFRALRGQAAQARITPQLQALRRRYARQPEGLQREMTALYTREGTSMLAGIWPMLVQWPLFSVLYLLFRATTVAGGPNTLLSHDFLGDSLGSHWLSPAGAFSVHGAVFLGVFAVLAAVCWLSARVSRRMSAASSAATSPAKTSPAKPASAKTVRAKTVPAKPASAKPASAKTVRAKTVPAKTVPARAAQAAGKTRQPEREDALAGAGAVGVLTKVLPYVTVVIAAFAPLAAAIYLTTSAAWGVGEREVFRRRAVASH